MGGTAVAVACHASAVAWLVSDARVLASAEVAETRSERRRGLLHRDGLDGAMVITSCRWVHTIGMRFPLDVAYVDDAGTVVKTVRMPRHRVGWPVTKAAWVIEAEAGAFERWGLHVGDVVELRDAAGDRPATITVADAAPSPGRLVLVGTPIGNLGDLSPRAIEALAGAGLVCCEDTRRTGRLLQHAGVTAARLAVCNEHTELARIGEVLDVLGEGARRGRRHRRRDAGHQRSGRAAGAGRARRRLRGDRRARADGVRAALVTSGLPAGRFVFEGFLPRSGRARRERLDELAGEARTIVLYEAPHRVCARSPTSPTRSAPTGASTVARELTKLHETVVRGTLGDVDLGTPRGEYVLVVDGRPARRRAARRRRDPEALRAELAAGASRRDAAAAVAARLGVPAVWRTTSR